jgi:hypothetical protein
MPRPLPRAVVQMVLGHHSWKVSKIAMIRTADIGARQPRDLTPPPRCVALPIVLTPARGRRAGSRTPRTCPPEPPRAGRAGGASLRTPEDSIARHTVAGVPQASSTTALAAAALLGVYDPALVRLLPRMLRDVTGATAPTLEGPYDDFRRLVDPTGAHAISVAALEARPAGPGVVFHEQECMIQGSLTH